MTHQLTPSFRQARNKDFVEQLTRQNMDNYYRELDIKWDRVAFDNNWGEFENYEITVSDCPVGVLRMSHDGAAYYIRDLQIEPKWQRQGIGAEALDYAAEAAHSAGYRLLRLKVFCVNPAVALYKRAGFRICKTEEGTHYMERELS